jgi:hypothetical protein
LQIGFAYLMHSSCNLIKGRISTGAGVLPVFTKNKPLLCTSRLPSLTRTSASMSWLWTFGEGKHANISLHIKGITLRTLLANTHATF